MKRVGDRKGVILRQEAGSVKIRDTTKRKWIKERRYWKQLQDSKW
jgi:hypothetical protein